MEEIKCKEWCGVDPRHCNNKYCSANLKYYGIPRKRKKVKEGVKDK